MHKQLGKTAGVNRRNRDPVRSSRQYRLHASDSRRAISDFYIALDTPVSLSCYILFKYSENDQLVSKEVSPSNYLDADTFRDDFAAVSFMRKNASLKTSFNLREAALTSFWESEQRCGVVNNFFSNLQSSSRTIHRDDWYVINSQIRKIDRILGEFDIDKMLDSCRWGPGVTCSVTGDSVSAAHKFDLERDITPEAYRLFGDVLRQAYPLWAGLMDPRIRICNKVVTVPKNAKTDRTIAIEPGLNIWIQLGIGQQIRNRLRFSGYNLNSDLKNQRGAYKGSVDDSLATIDFKAASDSLSRGLVEFLLPPRWHRILDSARSQCFELEGKKYFSNKFSSMGNGFTFELESLIFVTLALAVCECQGIDDSEVSVFGDDIVIPSACVSQLRRLCSIYGLQVNDQKSYSSGPFRESCGSYFFAGHDVKPIFLKNGLQRYKDVVRLANSIRWFSHSGFFGCDIRFKPIWEFLFRSVPKELQLRGPLSAGDSVFHDNLPGNPRVHPGGWEGYLFPALLDKPRYMTLESLGVLLSRLNTSSRDSSKNNFEPLRGKTYISFKKNMYCSQWYDFGPWIGP